MLPFWVHSGEYSKCDSAYSKSNLGFLIVNVKKGAHKRKQKKALRGPKCAKEISPRPLHHQPELLIQGSVDPCFDVFMQILNISC